jgi:hypothetical protein
VPGAHFLKCAQLLHALQDQVLFFACVAPAVAAAEPDGVKITWDNAKGSKGNLGDYYLSVMEAIERQSGGKGPIYFIQVITVCPVSQPEPVALA